MQELAGRVAVITGAASGIGASTAKRMAELGARVVVADVNAAGVEAVAANIRGAGGEAISVAIDVSVLSENIRLVTEAVTQFGRVDIAFANAGIAQPATPIEEMTAEHIQRLMAVNVEGVIGLAHAVSQQFKQQRSGVFVATASTAGVRPRPGIQVYSATKGAVIALVRALALEWAPFGIRACAVSPVATDTPMLPQFKAAAGSSSADSAAIAESFRQTVPLGRLAQPEDIADAVCFLASDRARMMTGTILDVDGGRNI